MTTPLPTNVGYKVLKCNTTTSVAVCSFFLLIFRLPPPRPYGWGVGLLPLDYCDRGFEFC